MQFTQADVANPDEFERTAQIEDISSLSNYSHLQQEPSNGLLRPSETHLPAAGGDVKMNFQDNVPSDADDLEDDTNLGARDTVMFCFTLSFLLIRVNLANGRSESILQCPRGDHSLIISSTSEDDTMVVDSILTTCEFPDETSQHADDAEPKPSECHCSDLRVSRM
jgi:hypothetical protein